MAEIIPALNRGTLNRMTTGERKLARCLKSLLDDDYLCWYDIPVGKKRRYPDFIVLHPARGLLFLEVKDWRAETLQNINKTEVALSINNRLVRKANPLEQARQYTYPVINRLSGDPALQQKNGKHAGRFLLPYAQGVVFTHISRRQIEKIIPDEAPAMLLPDRQVIYRDEFSENGDPELFEQRLWGMFSHQFGHELSPPQIDRIRWHLFPEVRIDSKQISLFHKDETPPAQSRAEDADTAPDIIRIMDLHQEQLARSLGEGHRVIHGVAGSGKTLILGYRCQQLAEMSNKPILVLCFNISLAARLRAFVSGKGIHEKVQVYHFHGWCAEQLKTHHADVIQSEDKYPRRQVESLIMAVDRGHVPVAQYAALLIDEGHDFEAAWLRLVVRMIDPGTNSLLLLYDDAQSIYRKHHDLGFSLKSVGIQAQGRTTVLKKNYRNTRQILRFAYEFAHHYLHADKPASEDIPLVEPEAAGGDGALPQVRQCKHFRHELVDAVSALKKWREQGIAWADMAVLYMYRDQGKKMAMQMEQAAIPHLLMDGKKEKMDYNRAITRVTLSTFHSSKGLEFPCVIIIGVGSLSDKNQQDSGKLLYVGMTRAQQTLLLTTSGDNQFSRQLLNITAA